MQTKLIIERITLLNLWIYDLCFLHFLDVIFTIISIHIIKLPKQVKNTHKSFQFHVILTDVQKTLHESN